MIEFPVTEVINVFVVKYALTEGILRVRGSVCDNINPNMFSSGGAWCSNFHNNSKSKEWCLTFEEALVEAEKLRQAQIKVTLKKLERLKEHQFKVVDKTGQVEL